MGATTRILGIDPGSRITGWGVIEVRGSSLCCLGNGHLQLGSTDMAGRLQEIFRGISEVIEELAPQQAAIEKVFVNRNVESALKLGQARGAAICAVGEQGLPLGEYSPTQIKRAIVGSGRADKTQVQHMVKMLMGLDTDLQADAADALAVAVCHAHTGQTLARMPGVLNSPGLRRSNRRRQGKW